MDNIKHLNPEKHYIPAITLERESPVPLHHQLAQKIRTDLENKKMPAGTLLPPMLTLASEMKLNRETARQAYAALEKENVIQRLPGGRRIAVSPAFEDQYKNKFLPALGIILPDKMEDLLQSNNSTALEVVGGIMDAASEMGFAAMPVPLPSNDGDFEKFTVWLSEMLNKLNGLVYLGESMGRDHSKAFEFLLSKTELPQVFIGGRAFREHLGTVTVNLETGISAALEHLREKGHREIALMGYNVPVRKIFQLQTIERLPMLVKLAEGQFHLSDNHIISLNYDLQELPAVLDNILKEKNPPTAIVCTCDSIAAEIQNLLAASERKLHNIALIGYNDSRRAGDCNLTSIRQPYRLTGKAAVEMIMDSRKKTVSVNSLSRILSTTLVVRKSTEKYSGFSMNR